MSTDVLAVEAASASCGGARVASVNSTVVSSIGGAGQGSGGVVTDATDLHAGEGQASLSFSAVASDFVQLTKPRIVVMILITTSATAMVGAGGVVAASQLLWLLVATGAVAASAGAANQVWERVIDRRMTRTASRPLPAGRMRTMPATVFTAVLGIAGTAMLAFMFGPVPALVGVLTWWLYVFAYTPMKTRTAWNTTVGAVAGALPVLIGYTAMGGWLGDWAGWLLVGVLVAWQYPHFMAIAWLYRRQYAEAGFCMTTTVEPTGRSAGLQSVAGSLALIGCGVALCCLPGGRLGALVAVAAVVGCAMPMLRASIRFAVLPGDAMARKLLRSSLLVLPAVLAIVTLRVFW
jgi:protoheme IX farnesyltransferase